MNVKHCKDTHRRKTHAPSYGSEFACYRSSVCKFYQTEFDRNINIDQGLADGAHAGFKWNELSFAAHRRGGR